jgi:hypothetical protein
MSVFDLDTKGQESVAEEARLRPIAAADASVGAFSGLGEGSGMGVMRGGARVGQLLGMVGGGLLQLAGSPVEPVSDAGFDAYGPEAEAARERVSDAYFEKVDDYANNAVDHWTPSHAEVGKVGQVLSGFSEIVLPLMASGGNPALLVGSQEMGQATDLARLGVDAETAVKAGLVQGAATAVGFRLPFLGSTLTSRIASGAAGNLVVNSAAAAGERTIIDSAGYKELAAQYDPFDLEARGVDILTGIAFGAIAHATAPRIRPSDREAIATANNAKHFQSDTAPGVPADIAASAAHQDALETAIAQTLRGEPVSVPVEVTRAEFHPRERNATARARLDAAADEGITFPDEPLRRNLNVPDAAADSALEYLTKSGGISIEQALAEGFDAADLRAQRVGIRHGFNRKGMSLESAGERLAQAGYPVTDTTGAVDKNLVLDMLDQELRGRKVFSANRASSELAREFAVQEAAYFEAGQPAIPADTSLPPAERVVEARFREQIAGGVDRAIHEYALLPESDGGRVLNTDVARELSADYRADRTRSAAVHEPASWLVKEMYRRALAEQPKRGQESRVVFTAGGTGSGKTTAISLLAAAADVVRTAQIVYDTNLNTLQSAITKIDQAIQAGKEVEIFYVARDPVQALAAGALPRAMRMGRTVPLIEHARTHVGSIKTIRGLAEHYEGDPRVHIEVIDNSHGKGRAALGSIDKLPNLEYHSVAGEIHDALEAELKAGRISEAVYRGTLGDYRAAVGHDAGAGQSSQPQARAGAGRQPQSPGEGGRVVDDPLTASLREHLAQSEILIPSGAVDEDGIPVMRSAREALEEIDAEIAEAQKMAGGIQAALTCFLQRGP